MVVLLAGDMRQYGDLIRSFTLAPELPGALDLIRQLKARGILVSAGHSVAIDLEMERAVEAGVSHVTHKFGNMGTLRRLNLRRVAGLVEYTLLDDHLTTEIIGDGFHISPLVDCWNLGTKEARGPAIVVNNTHGKGRTVYISGSLEAHYASNRVSSHRRILASAVRFLAREAAAPFTLSAPRGVYGVLRRAPDADLMLWLLANVGFKDADIGRMRQEYVPVSNVGVRVLIPPGKSVKAVHLVRARREVPFILAGGYAVMTLPDLYVAEIVHLELRS